VHQGDLGDLSDQVNELLDLWSEPSPPAHISNPLPPSSTFPGETPTSATPQIGSPHRRGPSQHRLAPPHHRLTRKSGTASAMGAAAPLLQPWTTVDVLYATPQAHGIVNVALHREYSPGTVFIFFQGRKDLYHV
jgi:hypothetical protein